MATSKTFFGKRRGSTKNFTFAVFNGKQVTKEKPEQVKNPRTKAQMVNRMILTTSSAAYAAMKEIVDHSFQGYVYGLQNMSRFQSVNNKLLRANLNADTPQFAYDNYGDARVLPGAYVIAEGSLAPIPTAMYQCAISAADSVAFTLDPGVSAAELTANALMGALGLQVGELATLCFLADCGTTAGYKFGFIRLTVKAAGDVQLTAQNLTDYFTIESNVAVAITSVADGTAVITATVPGVVADGGLSYGCIHSAQENGAWKRSDVTMTIAEGTTLAPTAAQAIATYPVGGSKILNDGEIPGGHVPAALGDVTSVYIDTSSNPQSSESNLWDGANKETWDKDDDLYLTAMGNNLNSSNCYMRMSQTLEGLDSGNIMLGQLIDGGVAFYCSPLNIGYYALYVNGTRWQGYIHTID